MHSFSDLFPVTQNMGIFTNSVDACEVWLKTVGTEHGTYCIWWESCIEGCERNGKTYKNSHNLRGKGVFFFLPTNGGQIFCQATYTKSKILQKLLTQQQVTLNHVT